MQEKTCFKCGEVKPICDFYRHPMMADGHLNKCKECSKKDTAKHQASKMLDPEWKEKELDRHRKKSAKYRLLGIASQDKSETRKKWCLANKHKKKAHNLVSRAIKNGLLRRRSCEVCGSKNSQAHHDDYNFPLDVIWLCPKHHGERHVELNRLTRLAK